MYADFWCAECDCCYRLRFLSLEEACERDRRGIPSFPLTCPKGHVRMFRV